VPPDNDYENSRAAINGCTIYAGWLAVAAMVCSALKRSMIMCPKPIVTGLILSSIVFATATAQAQVIVDVSKITCDQYVHAKITTPNLIAAWLSGYYNAKRNNKIIDLAVC
jgi:hypothetical protein